MAGALPFDPPSPMLDHFRMFARYNRWANATLLGALAPMSDEDWHRDAGLFFGSIHATLNHILVADLIWLSRFTGRSGAPTRLDAILHEGRGDLRDARDAMDGEIVVWVESLDEATLNGEFTYTPVTDPTPVTQRLAPALAHVFNHQTHHRGQVHAATTRFLDVSPAIDLIYFQRHERLGTA